MLIRSTAGATAALIALKLRDSPLYKTIVVYRHGSPAKAGKVLYNDFPEYEMIYRLVSLGNRYDLKPMISDYKSGVIEALAHEPDMTMEDIKKAFSREIKYIYFFENDQWYYMSSPYVVYALTDYLVEEAKKTYTPNVTKTLKQKRIERYKKRYFENRGTR